MCLKMAMSVHAAKKKFAMQHDINDIDFIHANITFDYQYLKHENELTIN